MTMHSTTYEHLYHHSSWLRLTISQLRIDVLETTFEARPYAVGTPLNPASSILLPQISLLARVKHVYFMPVDSFNLLGMFQNPMMLMLLFGGGMVIAMPYLMVRFHSTHPAAFSVCFDTGCRKIWTQKP